MVTLRQLIPIACPNGFDPVSGAARVSVYFAPRILSAPGGYAALPDWSDWPDALGRLTVTFTTNNGTVPDNQVGGVSIARSDIYRAVFADDTPVASWRATDRRDTPFFSFGEGAVAADILSLYRDIAKGRPLDPPPVSQLLNRPATSDVLSGDGQLAADLERAKAFQKRRGPVPASPAPEPTWEFHQAVSLIGRHPYLMRLLGLVADYTIPLNGPTSWVACTTDYQAVFGPGAAPDRVQELSPRVMVDNDFRIRPLHGGLVEGFLAIGGGSYDLVSLDVSSAIKRLGGLAREVRNEESSDGSLPPLSDAGLQLLRTARADELALQFSDDYDLERRIQLKADVNDTVVQVYAEHLRVGYRVDARRDAEDPRSLFGRQAERYHFPAAPSLDLVPPPDEGWVGTSYAEDRTAGGGGPSFRLSEGLARWRGWSLAVPSLGQVADTADGTVRRPTNTSRSGDPVQFEVDYRVIPGSLPRLRYGSSYVMRARAVDICGNSVPLATGAPQVGVSPAQVYGRLDPLPPPVVTRREQRSTPGLGDTIERVVIKSNYDVDHRVVPAAERMVFPPAAAQVTCERHGMPNGGLSGTRADYEMFVARDGLDVTDHCVPDPATGEPVAGTLDPGTGAVGQGPDSQTAVYLPDPAGPQLSLGNVPGSPGGAQVLATFTGAWPQWQTRRLVVKASALPTAGVPTVGAAGGPVTVFLPKAAQQVIDLSLAPTGEYAEDFGILQELIEENPADLAQLRTYVEQGRHWMVSSRKRIKLVHAVRQPLSIPSWEAVSADRPGIGSRTFVVTGTAVLNRPSTGRTILTGAWTDPVDDLSQPGPVERSGRVLIGTQKIGVDGDETSADVVVAHTFFDDRRHQVLVKQEAYTRFARDFAEQSEISFTLGVGGRVRTLDPLGVLAASVKLSGADGTTYAEGSDYALDAAAGTVTWLTGGAIAFNTPVTAVYVALPLSRFSDEEGAPDHELTVPNAKVPAPLPVHAVIPSFERTTRKAKTSIQVVSNPHVVRVYLERPWFDTGVGELLGVVLDPVSGADPVVGQHTMFGRDAIISKGDPPRPQPRHFPSGTPAVADGYVLSAHEVRYDTAQQKWYSDIEVPGQLGYRMFLRLALARYQPEAIEGAGLSRIDVQDSVVLGAERRVKVTRTKKKLGFAVAGDEHEGRRVARSTTLHNRVTVSVQGIEAGVKDKELRWSKRPLGDKELALGRRVSRGTTTWSGSLKLTKLVKATKGKRMRLVFTEYEPMVGTYADGVRERAEYVPVFTEVVELPPSWVKRTKGR